MAGELTTTNYGWTKPTVGASVDAWGGYINTDLDGIDSTVKSVSNAIPVASSTTPVMDGTATIGVGTTFARADHIHPTDTSRYAASNPLGYQTAANVTTALTLYAPLASPALTGVPTAPTAAPGTNTTQVATTAFVSALPVAMNDNRLINGDMRIDQRWSHLSGTASGYTVDRWQYFGSQAGKITWGGSFAGPAGFPYSLPFGSSSAYTPLAADNFSTYQIIEADMISDFAWGAAGAQPVTLSFWARSSLTGTFSGALMNGVGTRAYPFNYSLPTANTWTKLAVTIPGDTAGTWVMSGNVAGLLVQFDLGSGANSLGTAGAWVNGGFSGATGSVGIVKTNGATFYVTGVKLEIGSVATPFNRQSLAKSMADCQRYYQKLGGATGGGDLMFQGYSSGAGASGATASTVGIVTMRAAPTVTQFGAWTGNLASIHYYPGLSSLGVSMWASAAGQVSFYTTDATCFLTLSAEL